MPIASVFSIEPVFSVISSVPGVSGLAGAAEIEAGGGAGGPADVLVFSKAEYGKGTHGGPVPGYPASVTLIGSVERKCAPTLLTEGGTGPLRPQTQTTFEITTDEDPGTLLGAPLATNDLVVWAGFELLVVGTAIPQGAGWLTKAVLTT
jgi:hypothetical protein